MSFTFANARTFLRERDSEDGSTRADNVYKRIANAANIALRNAGKWDFDKRIERLVFNGRYNTGTVAVTAGGTTVTGTGTTFTAAMDERYIRLNGEDLQYRITAFGSTTSLTIETYEGESNLSGVTYEITEDRKALPARFRDFAKPIIDDVVPPLCFMRLEDLITARLEYHHTDYPRWYSVEWQEDSSIPQPYMWLYPAPVSKRVVTLPYYAWPPELSSDGDLFYVPWEAEPVIQEYLLAFLYREQSRADWMQQVAMADAHARAALANFRAANESRVRQEWHAGQEEGPGKDWDNRIAAGEPVYG